MLNFLKKTKKPTESKSRRHLQHSFLHVNEMVSWSLSNYETRAREGYVKNVVAHRVVNLLSTAAGSVPWLLYSVNSDGQRQQVKKHKILDLLKRPNCLMAGAEFFERLYAHRLISGNAYVQMVKKNGRPFELFLLRPDKVEVVMNENSPIPAGYVYRPQEMTDQEKFFPVSQIDGYSEILHIKNFNPLSDVYGISPMESAAYSIEQHNQASVWNQSLLKNGARPSGALVMKSQDGIADYLTEEQFARLKQQIDEKYVSAANAGRPILLEGGIEWQEMSMTPKDMDFIESKHSSARDIALAFGVPPQLLGIPGDMTYNNMQEARLALWEETILPLINSVKDSLNHWLSRSFGENLELDYDNDEISGLIKKREIKLNSLENVSFMTINEKRDAIGLGPIKINEKIDGDSL